MKTPALIGILNLLLLAGCNGGHSENDGLPQTNEHISNYEIKKPDHFPEIPIPEDNPMTEKKIELGKKLFFDPILSSDTTVSCASCHFSGYAFSDTVALSLGVENRTGKRNAPPLLNIAYASSFFRDGGAPTLEMQLITPIEDENEMNLDVNDAVERLKNNPIYVRMFEEVFNEPPSLFGLTRSIAAYERTLISTGSKYDRYLQTNDKSVFSEKEALGYELFTSNELKCTQCHSGFNLTNNGFHNNGIYADYADFGRANLTLDSINIGEFRVPSLRNIAITGPYMHDGSFATLEEVITHYSNGGQKHKNQDSLINGFEITQTEKEALIAFLNTLTDSSFSQPLNQ